MKQDNLRQQVKHLKTNGISYKSIAEGIKVNQSSFYSWVSGNYDFSEAVAERLEDWIKETLLDSKPAGKKYKTVRNLISLLNEYNFQDDELLRELPKYYDKDLRYYATNKGNIFSLCGKEWIKKKPQVDSDGYLYVDIYCNGDRTRKRIHTLVIEAFMPNEDLTGKQIHHIDQNRQNNNLENLLVVSPKKHALLHKYIDKWRIDEL